MTIFYTYYLCLWTDFTNGVKDLAIASCGVTADGKAYGNYVDGKTDIKPVTATVLFVDEVADAGYGKNSYGTNVDHRLGKELE